MSERQTLRSDWTFSRSQSHNEAKLDEACGMSPPMRSRLHSTAKRDAASAMAMAEPDSLATKTALQKLFLQAIP
jgi:hypothetical protein